MKLVDFLQGKWLGHPLHPAIAHVPVGGWVVACVLDVAAWRGAESPALGRLATWCVGTGLVAALLAVAPGVADWSGIKKEKPAWKIGLVHMVLNLLAALVWTVNFGLRWSGRDARAGMGFAVLVTSLIGTGLVLVSAYLGSLLVFDRGISVARASKKKWRERAVKAGARVPEQK